ncbi:hypothetical protein [Leisingera sp. M523]|uniref:hypothetical protein n=1 Tax=Leisingera sp. M523 TaxID=2867013 RepID=UPI0021A63B51|nr:hypothetical protein [Leisingera sp. M523]UWQ28385.1 hypothetical protein K3557_16710 [Leisingera sp. M523]
MLLLYAVVNLKTIFAWVFKWSLIVQLCAMAVCFPIVAIFAVLERELGLDIAVFQLVFPVGYLIICVLVALYFYSTKWPERGVKKLSEDG